MINLFLADSILIIHLLFIVFVVFGGLLVFYRKWVVWLHCPAFLWGALIEFSGWVCPLTPLENHFRRLAGQGGYDNGFIHTYLLKIIYPDGLTPGIQIFLGFGVLLINLFVYLFVYGGYLKKKRGQA